MDVVQLQYRIKKIGAPVYDLKPMPAGYTVPSNECEVTLNLGFVLKTQEEEFILTADVHFFEKAERKELLNFQQQMVFALVNFKQAFKVDETNIVHLPDAFVAETISITLGVIRGMIALKNFGSYLENIYLPIYNIAELLANLKVQPQVING
jgi:hypothetical protein